ncbi:MAG TPA: carboxypeptidase-like regulatory domain-containing protein, partial [Thermoanaerobaculia bacterium]
TADDFDGYPDFLYLAPGKYKLEFQLDGFETQTADIDAHGGARYTLNNKLHKIPGAKHYGSYSTPDLPGGLQRYFAKSKDNASDITVQPDSGYDNGNGNENGNDNGNGNENGNWDWRNRGSASGSPSDQEAPPQAPPPGKSYSDPSPPTNGVSAERIPAPTSGRARLVFKVGPADAAVYVDDRFAGTAEELTSLTRGLQIAPGMHKIVVSRPGFAPESTQVDVAAGQSETVDITLERH